MKQITILSSMDYEDTSKNYGDCILIDTGSGLIIYDCGHEKHAEQAIQYMDNHDYSTASIILSHNDSDHFDGIPTLLATGRISAVHTTLLLKYKTEICERIDDKRRNPDSVAAEILKLYDNIAKLSGEPIYDIYQSPPDFGSDVAIVGPNLDYMLDAVAKRLDGREGDTIDQETAVNATSLQVAVDFNGSKLLLCGDCSYPAIEDKVLDYSGIQLPHHGKVKQAEQIFQKNTDSGRTQVKYFVSDNTGSSNGGSDNLNTQGFNVKNTKEDGNIVIEHWTLSPISSMTRKVLGY